MENTLLSITETTKLHDLVSLITDSSLSSESRLKHAKKLQPNRCDTSLVRKERWHSLAFQMWGNLTWLIQVQVTFKWDYKKNHNLRKQKWGITFRRCICEKVEGQQKEGPASNHNWWQRRTQWVHGRMWPDSPVFALGNGHPWSFLSTEVIQSWEKWSENGWIRGRVMV